MKDAVLRLRIDKGTSLKDPSASATLALKLFETIKFRPVIVTISSGFATRGLNAVTELKKDPPAVCTSSLLVTNPQACRRYATQSNAYCF
jgi:hypothetical protein